jgi:transketolase
VLYDDNKVSLAAPTDVTFTEDVQQRFEAYGWDTHYVSGEQSGDVDALSLAISNAKAITDKPSLILVRSTIGYGSPRAGTPAAHGEPLGTDNVLKTKAALGWPAEPLFLIPPEAATLADEARAKGAAENTAWKARFAQFRATNATLAAQFERATANKAPADLPWPAFNAENGSVASRDAGGAVMNAIAAALPELIGGSADLDSSTKTYLKGFGDFQAASPAGRNVHFGVREHAMGAAINGMALHGGIVPFCATFFTFVDYLKPALRLAALNGLRTMYVFTHDSVFLGEDGPTHQPIEQLAATRAIPGVRLIRPADSLETLAAWKLMVESEEGPWVLVLSRQKLPFLGERHAAVEKGAYTLYEPEGTPDVILIGTGSEVSLALDAAKLLATKGTKARVVSMPSWELFDRQTQGYKDSVLPPAIEARVSIEAGTTMGWERYVGARGIAFGIDHYGTSAPAGVIAKEFGFTPEHIADVASGLLARA